MDATLTTIIAMLLQACGSTSQLPESVELPPEISEQAAPADINPVKPALAKLTCVLDVTDKGSQSNIVAKLVAPEAGASGNYMFGFKNSGQSSISIMRSSAFELGANEELVLAQTTTDTKGTLTTNLLVDGQDLDCEAV